MRTLLFFLLSALPSLGGTANAAARLQRNYEKSLTTWVEQIKAAATVAEQTKLWALRPDPLNVGKQLWIEIRNNLGDGWSIEYAAWILENAPSVLAPKENQRREPGAIRIRKAIERFHTQNPRVAPYCIAVTTLADPGSMNLLERIARENPDTRVRAAAALGQAILLRKLDQGGDAHMIQRRQNLLRFATIHGKGLDIGKRTLLSITDDEIFRLRKLTVGATALNLKGVDIAMKPFSLEDYRGQVVALFFWHTWMPEADRSLELMRELHQKLQGQKAAIIGVNANHAKVLREMTANGQTPWRNFFDHNRRLAQEYHIDRWPQVFVLDQQGEIKFKGVPGSFVDLAVQALLKK